MRAFRPSSFGKLEVADEEVERAKEENVRRYARLVQAGLPIFETSAECNKHRRLLIQLKH